MGPAGSRTRRPRHSTLGDDQPRAAVTPASVLLVRPSSGQLCSGVCGDLRTPTRHVPHTQVANLKLGYNWDFSGGLDLPACWSARFLGVTGKTDGHPRAAVPRKESGSQVHRQEVRARAPHDHHRMWRSSQTPRNRRRRPVATSLDDDIASARVGCARDDAANRDGRRDRAGFCTPRSLAQVLALDVDHHARRREVLNDRSAICDVRRSCTCALGEHVVDARELEARICGRPCRECRRRARDR